MHYIKSYTNPANLVQLMENRGLIIEDKSKAENYIRRIGYYRFSAYLHPLLTTPKNRHIFKYGSSFSQALMMYRFDRQLRVAMFNQIEKIEVAVRSAIANIMTKETGNPFWMTNPEYYTSLTTYRGSIQKVDVEYNKSREDFIKHFKSTYEDPYPPSWMLVEIISLGTLTRIYQSIKSNKIRKKIAQEFDLQIPVFESWMTIITVARNNCGHHARVWNRTFALRALTMRKNKRPWITQDVNMKKVYFSLCVIKYFINVIVPNNDMTAKLTALFADYPEIDITAMGFPKNWQQEPLWL